MYVTIPANVQKPLHVSCGTGTSPISYWRLSKETSRLPGVW